MFGADLEEYMPGFSLQSRLQLLLETQNADGGWGYVPGRQSWVEPTAYAMLALHSKPGAAEAVDRAWRLLRSWQLPNGAWPPAAKVDQAHWSTALCLTIHCVRKAHDGPFLKAVDWLVETSGAESTWRNRLLHYLRPNSFGHDPSVVGWPWLPGTGSWVEPTAHALIALRLSAPPLRELGGRRFSRLRRRIRMGERMLIGRRAVDGGWNYGNRLVLGVELPSYPETTGLALLGIQGSAGFDPSAALEVASRHYDETKSPLARAWLAICLRNYGRSVPERCATGEAPPRHLHLAALEALGAPDGNHALLAPESVV